MPRLKAFYFYTSDKICLSVLSPCFTKISLFKSPIFSLQNYSQLLVACKNKTVSGDFFLIAAIRTGFPKSIFVKYPCNLDMGYFVSVIFISKYLLLSVQLPRPRSCPRQIRKELQLYQVLHCLFQRFPPKLLELMRLMYFRNI